MFPVLCTFTAGRGWCRDAPHQTSSQQPAVSSQQSAVGRVSGPSAQHEAVVGAESLPGPVVQPAERSVDHGQTGLVAGRPLLIVGLRGAGPLGQQHVRRRSDGQGRDC